MQSRKRFKAIYNRVGITHSNIILAVPFAPAFICKLKLPIIFFFILRVPPLSKNDGDLK